MVRQAIPTGQIRQDNRRAKPMLTIYVTQEMADAISHATRMEPRRCPVGHAFMFDLEPDRYQFTPNGSVDLMPDEDGQSLILSGGHILLCHAYPCPDQESDQAGPYFSGCVDDRDPPAAY